MIITAPTGLYSSVLPKGPSDPTSVVYTISDGPPPRDESVYQQLPAGIQSMKRPARVFSDAFRRSVMGDCVYVTKYANPTKAITGSLLFAYGQVLDFTDVEPEASVPGVSDSITTKHNSNYIDLDAIGFDADDQNELAGLAALAQQSILDQIGSLQKELASLGADITGYQGQINEATKVLNGLVTIGTTGANVTAMIERVQVKLATLNANLTTANAQYSLIPNQINALRDDLSNLTNLVK